MAEYAGYARLLIVDDEADVRVTTRRILKRGGYEVFEADSAADAIAKAAGLQRPADLVIINTQDMPGPEVLRRLREIWPRVPAILSHDGEAAPNVSIAEGDPPVHFIPKPLRPEALPPLVDQIVPRPSRRPRP